MQTWREWIDACDFYKNGTPCGEAMKTNGFSIYFPKDENGRPNRAFPRETIVLPDQIDEHLNENAFAVPTGCMRHSIDVIDA